LDGGRYTDVSLDAMTQKVREGGRTVNVAVVIAVGVNAEGHREVLGFDVIATRGAPDDGEPVPVRLSPGP
jgi:transposase-like protein